MSLARPNIIQIVVDDMGNGDLSHSNGGASSTPVLDQLAADGFSLTQHYSGSPVCAPARAALLTGRYPHRTGVIDTMEARGLDRVKVGEQTIADGLSAAGYATGLVGKWHTGAFDPAFHPRSRGFDEFVGFQGGWQDYWDWRIEKAGVPMRADGRYLTEVFTAEALDFVDRHAHEPFFLHLSYNAPHFPLQAPEELIERFEQGGAVSRGVATIFAMLKVVDDGIGSLLQLLEDRGIADNTLIMFTSDNGPDFSADGPSTTLRGNLGLRGSKTLVYEGGIRVPMIVRWADGLAAAPVADDLVHFVDWMPTLLEVAGARHAGPALDGRSILGSLRGERAESNPPRFWQWTRYRPVVDSNAAMRDGDWKLVWPGWGTTLDVLQSDLDTDAALKYADAPPEKLDDSPTPTFERPDDLAPLLFDLGADPGETTDLAAEHPDRVRSMTAAIADWFDDVERSRLTV